MRKPASEETRRRMSEAQRKRFSDPAVREEAAARRRGMKYSPEARENMRAAQRLVHQDPAYKESHSAGLRRALGVTFTAEMDATIRTMRGPDEAASFGAIAERVGVSEAVLTRRAKELGIPTGRLRAPRRPPNLPEGRYAAMDAAHRAGSTWDEVASSFRMPGRDAARSAVTRWRRRTHAAAPESAGSTATTEGARDG